MKMWFTCRPVIPLNSTYKMYAKLKVLEEFIGNLGSNLKKAAPSRTGDILL